MQVEHLAVEDNFKPEVGFLRRDDFRRSFGTLRYSPRPAGRHRPSADSDCPSADGNRPSAGNYCPSAGSARWRSSGATVIVQVSGIDAGLKQISSSHAW